MPGDDTVTRSMLAWSCMATVLIGVIGNGILLRIEMSAVSEKLDRLLPGSVYSEGGNASVEIHPSDWQLGLDRMYRNKLNRENQEHGM